MKRDWDLIKKILLEIEQDTTDPMNFVQLSIEGYEDLTIDCHIRLLGEAGLVHVTSRSTMKGTIYQCTSLTWDGHEFLDLARNDTVWRRVMSKIGNVGGTVGIGTLTDLLKNAITDLL